MVEVTVVVLPPLQLEPLPPLELLELELEELLEELLLLDEELELDELLEEEPPLLS